MKRRHNPRHGGLRDNTQCPSLLPYVNLIYMLKRLDGQHPATLSCINSRGDIIFTITTNQIFSIIQYRAIIEMRQKYNDMVNDLTTRLNDIEGYMTQFYPEPIDTTKMIAFSPACRIYRDMTMQDISALPMIKKESIDIIANKRPVIDVDSMDVIMNDFINTILNCDINGLIKLIKNQLNDPYVIVNFNGFVLYGLFWDVHNPQFIASIHPLIQCFN